MIPSLINSFVSFFLICKLTVHCCDHHVDLRLFAPFSWSVNISLCYFLVFIIKFKMAFQYLLRAIVSLLPEKHNEQNSFSGKSQLCSWGLSMDWMTPIRIVKASLLYLKSTDCGCVPHLQNTFTAAPRSVFNSITGHYSLT